MFSLSFRDHTSSVVSQIREIVFDYQARTNLKVAANFLNRRSNQVTGVTSKRSSSFKLILSETFALSTTFLNAFNNCPSNCSRCNYPLPFSSRTIKRHFSNLNEMGKAVTDFTEFLMWTGFDSCFNQLN